jgi:hypothetical protein
MGGGATVDKLTYALAWAARGFPVFPLRPGSKKPLFKDWDWTQGATTDEATIRAWWTGRDYNIATLTDGRIVVDVDTKKGKPGLTSLVSLDMDLDELDTLTVHTPSGGKHLYYDGPNRSLSTGRLPPGLDIRSYHGYVVAPGSYLDPALPENEGVGGFYTVEVDAPVRRVPVEVLSRLDTPLDRQAAEAVATLDTEMTLERAAAYLAEEAPPAIEGQGGDLTTFKVAAALKDMGVSEAMAAEIMVECYNERCAPPWDVEELKQKVANAYAYGSRAPGAYSPEHEFSGVSIPELPPKPVQDQIWYRHGDGFDRNARWLYYKTLPATGIAFIVGPPQSAKTFVLVDLARSLATGKSWFDTEPDDRGGTVFLFAGSEGSGFAHRLAALQEEGALPISATRVSALGERGKLGEVAEAIKAETTRMQAQHGVPLRLVVLETLNTSGLIEDENDAHSVSQAMDNLVTLSTLLDILVIVSHHPPKGGQGMRGSGALLGAADYVVEIQRTGTEVVRTLMLAKARDAEQRRLGAFSLIEVDLGQDDRGRKVTSMVVSGSTASAAVVKKATYADLFVECVDFAMIDDGEDVDGKTIVEEESVAKWFKDRCPIQDRSNRRKQMKAAWEFAEGLGAVETVMHDGKKYLYRRERT